MEKYRWTGESGQFFTNGKEYEFLPEDEIHVQTTDDEGNPHSWFIKTMVRDGWAKSNPGPVRTVTRQEIIPGTYDGVGVNVGPEGELFIEVTPMATRDPARLERAAAVLTALAGALRDAS